MGSSFLSHRQPGYSPKWAVLFRRALGRQPGNQEWPQSNQGVQFPLWHRQPSFSPKWLPHVRSRRTRFSGTQEWPQGGQGVQFPLFTRQSGYRPKWAPHVAYRKGRVFQPQMPQAGQGVQSPLWHRQPSFSPKWLPHNAYKRGRVFQPPWPQAGQGVQFPLWTRQQPGPMPKQLPHAAYKRGRFFQPGWGQGIRQGLVLRSGSSAVVAASTGNTLTATHPSGAQAGDLILIWNTAPDPAISWFVPGFNQANLATGASMSAQLLWKIDSGAEPASYTVTSVGSTNAGLVICAYGNEDQVIQFDPAALSGQLNAVSSTILTNSVNLMYPGSQLVWFGAVQVPSSAPVITPPPGYIVRVNQATGTAPGTNVAILMADSPATATGPTGQIRGTFNQSQFNAGALVGVPVTNPVGQNLVPVRDRYLHRRRFAPRLSRSRQFVIPLGQGTQSAAFPVFIRQTRRVFIPGSRYVRGRAFQVPVGQGTQAAAFPVFTRRPLIARPGQPFIRRGRAFLPVPAQGSQGTAFPLFTRRPLIARPGQPFIRRGRFILASPPQAAQGFPYGISFGPQRLRQFAQEARRGLRGRISVPQPPQRGQGVQFPLWTRQAPAPPLRRFPSPRRRLRIFSVPIPKTTWQVPVALSGTGTLTASATITQVPAVAFSGIGSLTVLAVRTVPGTAAMHGTGILIIAVLVKEVAVSALNGTGTLAAQGVVIRPGTASLSASGSLIAAAQDLSAAHLAGAGLLVAASVLTVLDSAALSGSGFLTVTASAGPAGQRITITPNASATREAIAEQHLMEIRELHVAESYVVTQDLEDGTFDS